MKARIVSVENQDKGKYNALKITFRNLDSNKVLSTNVLSYTYPDVFATLKSAEVDSVWDIKVEKNENDFWDWTSAKPLGATDAVETSSHKAASYAKGGGAKANVAGRDFESKNERALRQVLIVRQSSITAALEYIKQSGVLPDDETSVTNVAAKFEAWVFRGKPSQTLIKTAQQALSEMDDDIPY